MRCGVVAVGCARDGAQRALFDEYAKRLSPPLELIEVEERRKLPEPVLRDREAELLVAALPKDAMAILLDEKGECLSTVAFADKISRWQVAGVSRLVFMIGGAAGHGAVARERADFTLSLGPMTWPHLLVRGMLAEQLYRAFSVISGHPYHRA